MFFARTYKPGGAKWPWYTLLALEFPLTVALLALFGIAAPDLYRNKLWQDGADNGFNSDPNTAIYAAANYRPYKTPMPWTQFITSYNVVIAVLSMFIMLAKAIMYIVHVFPPILSFFVHIVLVALYAVSVTYQSGPDTTDPHHPQHGAPWYITKSCSVTKHKANYGYCQQAKSAFAATIVMMGVFAIHTVYAAFSAWPTKKQRAAHSAKVEERKALEMEEDDDEENGLGLKQKTKNGFFNVPPTPMTPSHFSPDTPRTLAFNRLDGTTNATRSVAGPVPNRTPSGNGSRDLPLRNHFSSPKPPKSPTMEERRGMSASPEPEMSGAGGQREAGMYFPPPPTKAKGKK